jgi:hypothetical protein
MEEKKLLTAEATAARLHIAKRMTLRWVREDKIGCVKASMRDGRFSGQKLRLFISAQPFIAFARIKFVSTAQDERVGGLE